MTGSVATWYVRRRGRLLGPYRLDQLERLERRKQISVEDEFSTDRRNWAPLGTLEALFPPAAEPAGPGGPITPGAPAQPPPLHGPPPLPGGRVSGWRRVLVIAVPVVVLLVLAGSLVVPRTWYRSGPVEMTVGDVTPVVEPADNRPISLPEPTDGRAAAPPAGDGADPAPSPAVVTSPDVTVQPAEIPDAESAPSPDPLPPAPKPDSKPPAAGKPALPTARTVDVTHVLPLPLVRPGSTSTLPLSTVGKLTAGDIAGLSLAGLDLVDDLLEIRLSANGHSLLLLTIATASPGDQADPPTPTAPRRVTVGAFRVDGSNLVCQWSQDQSVISRIRSQLEWCVLVLELNDGTTRYVSLRKPTRESVALEPADDGSSVAALAVAGMTSTAVDALRMTPVRLSPSNAVSDKEHLEFSPSKDSPTAILPAKSSPLSIERGQLRLARDSDADPPRLRLVVQFTPTLRQLADRFDQEQLASKRGRSNARLVLARIKNLGARKFTETADKSRKQFIVNELGIRIPPPGSDSSDFDAFAASIRRQATRLIDRSMKDDLVRKRRFLDLKDRRRRMERAGVQTQLYASIRHRDAALRVPVHGLVE